MKLLEVTGISRSNGGARLMMHAVAAQQHDALHGYGIATAHTSAPYAERAEAGLYQRIWFQREPYRGSSVGNVVPAKIKQMYGLVAERDIVGVLDASGFAYSDQHNPRKTELLARLARRWKRRGKAVILLPQAFGPFSAPALRQHFAEVLAAADLVFARDPVSRDHVLDVRPSTDVRMAPDFTNLLPGRVTARSEALRGRVCVVPNYRMIDRTDVRTARAYRELLGRSVALLRERGVDPYVLLHESDRDADLAAELQAGTKGGVDVVVENDPLVLKAMIGGAHAVLGARFHGLVSALSQGVPCLAVGWSHKYAMLMEDYGCEDLLVDLFDPGRLTAQLDQVIPSAVREERSAALGRRGVALQEASRGMWKEVRGVLDASSS